jgi:hypothetical protein
MTQHPLDGEMRLAGVGRPEHGSDARAGRAIIRERGRRESHYVQVFLFKCRRSNRRCQTSS